MKARKARTMRGWMLWHKVHGGVGCTLSKFREAVEQELICRAFQSDYKIVAVNVREVLPRRRGK